MRTCGIVLILLIPSLAAGFSEPSSDAPVDSATFSIAHAATPSCAPYAPLEVTAAVVSPTPDSLVVTLLFRRYGDVAGYSARPMESMGRDLFCTSVPARIVADTGVEYYIEARAGMAKTALRSATSPFMVPTAYRFTGTVPDELPGDDYLRQMEPPPDPVGAADTEAPAERRGSSLSLQIILLLVLGALGYLIYQRIGSQ